MNKNILLVDDSDTERMYISELLSKIEEFSVDEASGPGEAMGKLARKKYDLIFIDYYMPASTGESFLNEIFEKNPGENAGTQAVVMGSAVDFQGDFLKRSGFVNYLEKPVEFNMLKAAVSLYAKASD